MIYFLSTEYPDVSACRFHLKQILGIISDRALCFVIGDLSVIQRDIRIDVSARHRKIKAKSDLFRNGYIHIAGCHTDRNVTSRFQ